MAVSPTCYAAATSLGRRQSDDVSAAGNGLAPQSPWSEGYAGVSAPGASLNNRHLPQASRQTGSHLISPCLQQCAHTCCHDLDLAHLPSVEQSGMTTTSGRMLASAHAGSTLHLCSVKSCTST